MNGLDNRRSKIEGFLNKRNADYSVDDLVSQMESFLAAMNKHGKEHFPNAPADWGKEEED